MNSDHPLNDDTVELAALYVAGALPSDEAAEVETRIAKGDRTLAAEIATYGIVIEAFNEGTSPIEPDSRVRKALLDRIASIEIPRDAADSHSKIFIRRAQGANWVEYGIPGIQVCILFRDIERNVQTSLFRMAPGSELPEHFHRNFEECFVLEGEVETHGNLLSVGDYVRAPAGSPHGRSRSEKGCLILLISEFKG